MSSCSGVGPGFLRMSHMSSRIQDVASLLSVACPKRIKYWPTTVACTRKASSSASMRCSNAAIRLAMSFPVPVRSRQRTFHPVQALCTRAKRRRVWRGASPAPMRGAQ